jgi:hypothetical protein
MSLLVVIRDSAGDPTPKVAGLFWRNGRQAAAMANQGSRQGLSVPAIDIEICTYNRPAGLDAVRLRQPASDRGDQDLNFASGRSVACHDRQHDRIGKALTE